jgi:rhodanese-related sulfurtransferase
MTSLLPATQARSALARGATLVDIRTPAEFRREHVPGSVNIPLDRLDSADLPPGPLLFTCRSGARTAGCADRIALRAGPGAMILDGGLMAWRAAGGIVATDRRQPIDIMRQVQIVAGSLVLLGLALGLLISPGYFGLSAFVGAGLAFAGATGWCGMARLLALMPWNRTAA